MLSWKKMLSIISIGAVTFLFLANFYYEDVLPYKVAESTFSLNNQTPEIEIFYHDPDISYRAMQIDVVLEEGGPIEIIYVQCSDDAYITLNEGSTSFTHSIGFSLRIRLSDANYWANGSYSVIDRTSFLVPKSVTKACSAIPKIAFYFNLTFIIMSLSTISVFIYIIVFKRDLIAKLFNKNR
ncbi:MAG: hypothetical protein ACXABI_01865 [Candidatus Hodarchaeales archaeon]|jgi:hypothetical protein